MVSKMKLTVFGADISSNDVSCSQSLINNIKKDIPKLKDIGAYKAALTNVTGDDLVIAAYVEDDLLEDVNRAIIQIMKDNAESLGDLEGISEDKKNAGEGVSYALADLDLDIYPDSVILHFDTYGGEPFVEDVANAAISAARSMDGVFDICKPVTGEIREIPGVGYVSNETDDPVICATVNGLESVGTVSFAMIASALAHSNTYLVKSQTPCNVVPGSVILSASAFMNGNVLDLAVPFENKTRILR